MLRCIPRPLTSARLSSWRTIRRQVSNTAKPRPPITPPNTPAHSLPRKALPGPLTWALNWTGRLTVCFLAGHIFLTYFYSLEPAYGISMLPTIAMSGDWVVISKYYRRGREVKVGDIVSYRHPVYEDMNAAKRVIGLEGDFVLMNTPGKSDVMIQVPTGHFWAVGDNLTQSRDSRMYGPVPMALINGKLVARVVTGSLFGFKIHAPIDGGLQPAYLDDDLD